MDTYLLPVRVTPICGHGFAFATPVDTHQHVLVWKTRLWHYQQSIVRAGLVLDIPAGETLTALCFSHAPTRLRVVVPLTRPAVFPVAGRFETAEDVVLEGRHLRWRLRTPSRKAVS